MELVDQHESWKRFVWAVINLRAGSLDKVRDYLRDIEARQGRAIAERVRDQVKVCAKAESWKNVERWPSWGYKFKPPQEPSKPESRPSSRRGRRT